MGWIQNCRINKAAKLASEHNKLTAELAEINAAIYDYRMPLSLSILQRQELFMIRQAIKNDIRAVERRLERLNVHI